MDRGAWWAAVHGVAKSQTQLSDFTFIFHFHFSLSCFGEGNGNPLQYYCLENLRDRGVWWAAVYGVAQSRTRLKRLNSISSVRWGESGLLAEMIYHFRQPGRFCEITGLKFNSAHSYAAYLFYVASAKDILQVL